VPGGIDRHISPHGLMTQTTVKLQVAAAASAPGLMQSGWRMDFG
jgi:hypothetical protein